MSKDVKSAPGRTVADFKAVHDRDTVIPARIQAGIDKMLDVNGKEHWEYESDFIREYAAVSQTDISKYRDRFKDYWFSSRPVGDGRSKTERNVWFASKAAAKECRPREKAARIEGVMSRG